MAKSRKDCLDEIARKSGKPRAEAEDILNDIFERAEQYEHDGLSPDESYGRARDEMLSEIFQNASLRRRAEILDSRKMMARSRYYKQVADQIAALPVSAGTGAKLSTQAPRLALEAKLVGVNLPFRSSKLSVDAQRVALDNRMVGGMARDLEQAGLLKIFASRAIEDTWAAELFELNRGRDGKPGISKDAHALAIAKIVQKWQRSSIDAINREGGWVRSYSGYITRTSHSPDKIRAAGVVKWAYDVLPLIDLKRTFGTDNRQHVLDALHQMHLPFSRGDHFDYGKPIDEPIYPNLASKASSSRELHFKSGKDWLAYNDKYGVTDPTQTVVNALRTAARRTALMKEFGTKPAEAFEKDLLRVKATLQAEGSGKTQRLDRLRAELEAKPNDAALKAEADKVTGEIEASSAKFLDFQKWEQALRNRFAQLDGSAQRPVNTAAAQAWAGWMSVQRMAKLGRVAITHFESLMTKPMEARWWGIGIGDRYSSLFRGLTQGLEGSDKRQALELTLVGFESRLSHMMNRYDVADAPRGNLARLESLFFKLTGVSSVTDNQRGDFAQMAAAHLGSKRGTDWAGVGRKEQRVLDNFGIGEAEWKALHGVDWTTIGDRTFLFPSDALKLSDAQVASYMRESREGGTIAALAPAAADIAKAREDLALKLATALTDRANTAIPLPNARTRAIIFQKGYEAGTPLNTAIRLLTQFKIWGADMIVRQWGREIYGTIGDTRMDRVAGLVEFLTGSIVLGVAGEAIRQAIQGKNPIAELTEHPFAAIVNGLTRSGFGTLMGDFLLGEFDRHGFSGVASLAGPTFGQIDTLLDLLHAGGRTKEGMFSKPAMRERGADLIRLARDNLPFMNLWATSLAMNVLVWHRLQEWINPGYLARSERRARDQTGTQFWMSPAKTDQWLTGRRPSPF